MKIDRVGFVGWRGMVGSVLLERMRAENDFDRLNEAVFFTTSQAGQAAPDVGIDCPPLQDAYDILQLSSMDVIAEAEKPADSPVISGVNMKVKIAAKARKQKLDAVWRRTEANCPVVFIFKENIPVNIEVETVAE